MPAPFSAEFEYLVFSWLHRIWVLAQCKSLWKARSREEKLPLTQQQPTGPGMGGQPEATAHSPPGESVPPGRPLPGPHYTTCQRCVCLVWPCRLHVTMLPTADSWSSSLTFIPRWLWWKVGRQGSWGQSSVQCFSSCRLMSSLTPSKSAGTCGKVGPVSIWSSGSSQGLE